MRTSSTNSMAQSTRGRTYRDTQGRAAAYTVVVCCARSSRSRRLGFALAGLETVDDETSERQGGSGQLNRAAIWPIRGSVLDRLGDRVRGMQVGGVERIGSSRC